MYVTANMATLAVCMHVPRSQPSLRHSVLLSLVSQVRHALVQTFTVIFWCEGAALAIGKWVFLSLYVGTLAVSVLGC